MLPSVMVAIEDLCDAEWADWYRMTPAERWEASAQLWHHFVAMGVLALTLIR